MDWLILLALTPFQGVLILAVSFESVLAQTNFSGTVTLGSILLGIIVLVVAAMFTIRSNVAAVWRQEAEGWKAAAEREQEKREAALLEHAEQLEAERVVRHQLKDELATVNALLLVEKAKPDVSALVELSKENYANAMRDISSMVEGIISTQAQMLTVLDGLSALVDRSLNHKKE